MCYNNCTMKAYRIHAPQTISFDELEAIPVGDNCVKLKNLVCGISSTDVMAYSGKIAVEYPIIPGRQCVGFVSEVGEGVTSLSRGNRVVVYPQGACHACQACKDGRFYDCARAAVFGVGENGFLSDFSVVSADDVYAIPDRLKDVDALFVEHIAMAINVLSKLNVEKGEHLVIVGATVIGIILAQVAMYYQAVPIITDMREDMLELARKAGVYYTVNSINEDVNKKVLSLTGGHMADACAFMLASPMPLRNVFSYTKKRGRVALVGNLTDSTENLKCTLDGFVERKLEMYTVTDCGKNYVSAINMLANNTVSAEVFQDNIIAFKDVPAAFKRLCDEPDSVPKIVVRM